jgi:hypothetical protein
MPHHQVKRARATSLLQDTLSVFVNQRLGTNCLRSYSKFQRLVTGQLKLRLLSSLVVGSAPENGIADWVVHSKK